VSNPAGATNEMEYKNGVIYIQDLHANGLYSWQKWTATGFVDCAAP
jgi:hypothetical protein